MKLAFIVEYDGKRTGDRTELAKAMGSVQNAIASKSREPANIELSYWRHGDVSTVKVQPGRLGVLLSRGDPASSLRSDAS